MVLRVAKDVTALFHKKQIIAICLSFTCFILSQDSTVLYELVLCDRTEYRCVHLENDVSLLQVPVLGSQACTGHLFNEDLTPQTQTILCKTTQKRQHCKKQFPFFFFFYQTGGDYSSVHRTVLMPGCQIFHQHMNTT